MFSKSAEIYDEVYSFKNYHDEVQKITALLENVSPHAHTVLDVACGTAQHDVLLSPRYAVDGIDINPDFISIAQKKNPNGSYHVADMRTFSLPRRYDVILCLFSSIGYLTKEEDLVAALLRFKAHLNPHGIVLVEPWFSPTQWKEGVPHMVTVDTPDKKICRMNVSRRRENISIVHFHYLVGDSQGVELFEEQHELALYTKEQMLSFFERAKLSVEFDPVGLFGRGLYVGRA